MKTITPSRVLLVIAVAATLLVGACSSSTTGTTGTTGSNSGSGLLNQVDSGGSGKPPILLGYYNQVNSPTLNFPEYTEGTVAAVDYINKHLGGVDGRQLQLYGCATAGTPESTQDCAQTIAAQHPVAVVAGSDFNQPAANPIFASAGIPQIGSAPLQPADYAAKDTFYFVPGTAGYLAAEGLFAADVLHAKSVGIIYDSPAVKAGLSFITGPLDRAGVKHVEVDASNSTDFTGPFLALNPGGQDAIITVFGSSSACIGLGHARTAQQSTTPVVALSACRAPAVLKAAGSDQEGWYYTNGFEDVTNTPSPDIQTLISAVAQYATVPPRGLVVSAFESMMTIYSVLKAVGAQLDPSHIAQYMQTASGKVFAGPAWKCGELSHFPTVCSASSLFYKVTGNTVQVANDGNYIDASPALIG